MAEAFKDNSELYTLYLGKAINNLENNNINDEGALRLALLFSSNTNLLILDLSICLVLVRQKQYN